MIIAGTTAHAVQTLLDSKKGSLTNRVDCAKEHAKNDIKAGAQIGLPIAAVTAVGVAKPDILKILATKTGTLASKVSAKLGGWLAKYSPKASNAFNKSATFLSKNAYKAGALGLITAGTVYVLNKMLNHAEQKGKIDQKYEDAAAIECHTKNIVLQA
jgi:hypothetical protein